jgi:hypothetical protein
MNTLTLEATKPLLEQAPLFRKICRIEPKDLEFVEAGQEREILTIVRGIVETRKMARAGDVILTGPEGERFVSSRKSFDALHTPDEKEAGVYHTQHKVRALLLTEDTIVKASWGEDMEIKAGGVAVLRLNDGRFYGNQGITFEPTYTRVDENNNVVCRMSFPLETQLQVAQVFHAERHIQDIRARFAFLGRPSLPPGPQCPWSLPLSMHP